MKRILATALVCTALCMPSTAAVTGRVVDGSGTPVFDAMINYTNPDNRLVYVYTNDKGEFSLPDPSTWDVMNLQMYNTRPTSVNQAARQSVNSSSGLNMFVRGASATFTVEKSQSPVIAGLYALSGKHIATILNSTLARGTYTLSPFANQKGLSHQLYVVRVQCGDQMGSARMLYTGNTATAVGAINAQSSVNNRPVLAKAMAVDGIRAGKTCYSPATKQIDSYSQAVGDLTIINIKQNIEDSVTAILGRMTLDQKIGQTVQSGSMGDFGSPLFAGSMLKGSSFSAQQSGQNTAMGAGAKVPATIGTDYVHGGPKVYFPHNIGQGCAGDPLLTEMAYRITGINCRVGNNVNFAPCIDMPRDDRNGRVYEGWSENVEDVKVLAAAAVRGLQGTDLSSEWSIIATLKHFAFGGATTDGVMTSTVTTGTWDVLCKVHLPQFHAAIDAGAASVMSAYNTFYTSPTNTAQVPMTCHKILLTDTLKNAWKFEGFVVSDWMMTSDAAVGGTTNGPINSLNAGLDLGMQPQGASGYCAALKANVGDAAGKVPLARIEDAARRHMRIKMRMGLWQKPMPKADYTSYFSDPKYRQVARALVRKSLVLLKNDGAVLPLKKTQKIYVVGKWADNMGYQCGGWSETGGDAWQGSDVAHGIAGATTIKEAITAAVGTSGRVTYGADASAIPTDADVVVVAVGETPYAEYAGYRTDITLPADQIALVQNCKNSGKPVVTILITGRPNPLGTIPANSNALVAAWLPGTEGTGIADVLFGDYNFTGKLSFTWPANAAQNPINYGSAGERTGTAGTPLYAFGYGLKY